MDIFLLDLNNIIIFILPTICILLYYKKYITNLSIKNISTYYKLYNENLYLMDFPSRPPKRINEIDLICEALGKKTLEILAYRDLIAVFNDQDEILSISPDLEKLKKIDYPSIVVTSLGDNSDFVSRNFAPKLGIPEDPVTGSSHCELIPYWSNKINKKEMIALQLSERGGKIYCTNKDNRVLIGGKAVTFLRGEIDLNF